VFKALQEVSADFEIASPLARTAKNVSASLLSYCGDHGPPYPSLFCMFSEKLVAKLQECFSDQSSFKREKEQIWGSYHLHRSTTDFQKCWIEFVEQSIHQQPSPSFYQHVTHNVFQKLIKIRYPISESPESKVTENLTREEENALRYVAGYVVRKVRSKLKRLSTPNKDEMILCLAEMYGDEWDEEMGTEDWTNLIDRGGLWHVNDQAYNLFYAIEEEVRKYFIPKAASEM
jgi:hypothetical protein